MISARTARDVDAKTIDTKATDTKATGVPREECFRCFRPTADCYCATVPSLTPRTKVLLLQHPRERSVAIGTARMCHLALTNSALRVGTDFVDDSVVNHALDTPGTALLFPAPREGDDEDSTADGEHVVPRVIAKAVDAWAGAPPRTLIVIDGTWSQAQVLLRMNPRLRVLPRVSLRPETPGNYRIRREPQADFLSTVEAVSQTLQVWEGSDYARMLHPFDFLVERQLAAANDHGLARSRRPKDRAPGMPELARFIRRQKRPVVVYVEANRHAQGDRPPGAPELVHLVAERLDLDTPAAPRATLDLILTPRRRAAPHLATQLGLAADAFDAGISVDDAKAAFANFVDDSADQICLWGQTARDVLTLDDFGVRGFVDVRALAARTMRRPSGGVLAAEGVLCGPSTLGGDLARARRYADALANILTTLIGTASDAFSADAGRL